MRVATGADRPNADLDVDGTRPTFIRAWCQKEAQDGRLMSETVGIGEKMSPGTEPITVRGWRFRRVQLIYAAER